MMARPFHRISVLARENPFPETHPDHALFAVVKSGQSPIDYVHATGTATPEGDDQGPMLAAIRALQRWADYGIVAFVPIDPPNSPPPPVDDPPRARGLKLARKAAAGLGRSVGKAVRHA